MIPSRPCAPDASCPSGQGRREAARGYSSADMTGGPTPRDAVGNLRISSRARRQAAWMIQEMDRSCRIASCCVSASMTELKYKVTLRFVDIDAPRAGGFAGDDTPAALRRDVSLGEVNRQPQGDPPVLRPGQVALVGVLIAVHIAAGRVVLQDDVAELDVQGEVVVEERVEANSQRARRLAAGVHAGQHDPVRGLVDALADGGPVRQLPATRVRLGQVRDAEA